MRLPFRRYSLATLFVVITIASVGMAVVHYAGRRSIQNLQDAVLQNTPSEYLFSADLQYADEVAAVSRWGVAGDAARLLAGWASDDQQKLRTNARRALSEFLSEMPSDVLLEWLSEDFGGWAAGELARRKDSVFSELQRILLNSPNEKERGFAVYVFLQSGVTERTSVSDVTLMCEVLRHDPSPLVRCTCAGALRYSKSFLSASVPALIHAVNNDSDVDVVFSSARVLGQLNDACFDQVSGRLLAMLASRDANARLSGVWAIGVFSAHAGEALPVLRTMATSDEDHAVRKEAAEMVEYIEKATQ
jgi:HEAT repeat protein